MNFRALCRYYFSLNMYTLIASLIFGIISGPAFGIVIFCSFGILVGFLAYGYFNNNEYYMYYNMGVTKFQLVKTVFFGNIVLSLPILLIYKWLF